MDKLNTNSKDIIKNIKQATGESPDIVYRELKIFKKQVIYLVYSQALGDSNKINDFILKSITTDIKRNNLASLKEILELFKNTIPNASLNTINNYNDLFFFLYSGFALIIIDGYDEIIVFEGKAALDRGVQETTVEPITSGPRDGLTEDFYKNIGLIRKRLRDKSLWLKEYIIGEKSNTRVGLLYINGLADEKLVNYLKNKLDSINIDGIVDTSQLGELLIKTTKSTFPLTFRTERPDLISIHLLKGKIIITIDN
ncbi:MAG: spore germination protein, partial [Bacilli bacterium]|nr:spore germination protein [Bacilli bacterium]